MGNKGRYGKYGGQYVSETLMSALIELEDAYGTMSKDPQFIRDLAAMQYGVRGARDTADVLPERLPGSRVQGVPEARGPRPRRLPQTEQHARAGAPRTTHGEEAADRRDRCRPARGRDRDRRGCTRHAGRGVHGGGGHEAAGAQRLPDGTDGRKGHTR